MLTPEIKTNLILKEIGIKRYSLRSKKTDFSEKNYNFYQKGNVLAIIDKPFVNFVKEQQDLIKAILSSTKLDDGDESYEELPFHSQKELDSRLTNMKDLKLVILFGEVSSNLAFNCETIVSPSVNQLIYKQSLKKELWQTIKNKLKI